MKCGIFIVILLSFLVCHENLTADELRYREFYEEHFPKESKYAKALAVEISNAYITRHLDGDILRLHPKDRETFIRGMQEMSKDSVPSEGGHDIIGKSALVHELNTLEKLSQNVYKLTGKKILTEFRFFDLRLYILRALKVNDPNFQADKLKDEFNKIKELVLSALTMDHINANAEDLSDEDRRILAIYNGLKVRLGKMRKQFGL